VTTRRFDQLVSLAAQLYPDVWRQNPIEAFDRVKDDLKRLKEHEQTEADLAQFQQEWETAKSTKTYPNVPFEEGVKEITGEESIVRAMKKFRDFAGSLTKTEQERDAEIELYRKDGFEPKHMGHLADDFPHWHIGHKSAQARKSRSARAAKSPTELKRT
jgi:hypothetical protein